MPTARPARGRVRRERDAADAKHERETIWGFREVFGMSSDLCLVPDLVTLSCSAIPGEGDSPEKGLRTVRRPT
ncbi:hypothetical protein GCM10028775_72430 [Catellatospora paridis]